MGAILRKQSKISFDMEGHIDPLIDMDLQNRKIDLGLKPNDERKRYYCQEAMEKYTDNKEKAGDL